MKETLAKLQYDLVVFPVDKPTFNITFICNRSYDNTLFKEFGVIGTPKKTCKLICDYNKSILLNSTVNEIKQYLSMSITEKMRSFQLHHGYQNFINQQLALDLQLQASNVSLNL